MICGRGSEAILGPIADLRASGAGVVQWQNISFPS